ENATRSCLGRACTAKWLRGGAYFMAWSLTLARHGKRSAALAKGPIDLSLLKEARDGSKFLGRHAIGMLGYCFLAAAIKACRHNGNAKFAIEFAIKDC